MTLSKFSKRRDRPAFNRYKMAVVFWWATPTRQEGRPFSRKEDTAIRRLTILYYGLFVVLLENGAENSRRAIDSLRKQVMELLLTTIRRTTYDQRTATVERAAPAARYLYLLESTVPARADSPAVTPCRAMIGRLLDRSTHHARSPFLHARRCSARSVDARSNYFLPKIK